MAARQEAPQRSLSAQEEAAVWVIFARPLQQALHTEVLIKDDVWRY